MKKRYRVAVIGRTGRGNYGHGLDQVWHEVPATELVAVADDNKAGLAAALKKLKVNKGFADYRKMLDEVKPDIVAVAPRWLDQHASMVIAAAQRGIHIYMEKPMCRDLEEADRMVDACEKTHVKLAIAHQTRYSPTITVARKLIAEGKIGKVLEVRGRGKEDRRGGGEDLWVLGSHVMDLMRLFGGNPRWCFARVLQKGKPITGSDVIEGSEGIGPLAGDHVSAVFGMPEGINGYFNSQRNVGGRPSRFGLQIFGSRGILDIHTRYLPVVKLLSDSSWSPGQTGSKWVDVSSAGIGKPEPLKDGGLHAGNVAAVKDLISAIENNRNPISSVYDARGATEMIAAVFDSHRLGGPTEFPLKNRKNPLALLK